jgi:hypothetical protein
MKKVVLVGDIHGNFDKLSILIEKEGKEDAVFIQLGDFGIWPPENLNVINEIKTENKIYFIPGNHENWSVLSQFENGKIHQLNQNIYFCAFNSRLTIGDKTFGFFGGADSIDKMNRIEGLSWWRNEVITTGDMECFLNNPAPFDIGISHTCPNSFDLESLISYKIYADCSRVALDHIFKTIKPENWYFGHFHASLKSAFYDGVFGCEWQVLNHIRSSGKFYEIIYV